MNILKECWAILQKCSLIIGLPVLLFIGLRRHKDTPDNFARHSATAFVLLGVILGILSYGAYEDKGLIWPGAVALGFMLVFGSALFRVRPVKPEPEAKTTAAPREQNHNP